MGVSLGVAVFARTPESGGKTRLAESWSRPATDAFYLHCLACAGQWLRNGSSLATGYWALTGEGERDHPLWRDGRVLEQVDCGLGERMADIADQLLARHDSWCLVGSDIPQLPPLAELDLTMRLVANDIVFGPSTDGGFWLVAGRRKLPAAVWNGVVYSRSDTMAQMIGVLSDWERTLAIDTGLPLLHDVDRFVDLAPLVRALGERRPALNKAQLGLLDWLETTLPARQSGVGPDQSINQDCLPCSSQDRVARLGQVTTSSRPSQLPR